jgi:amidase
MIDEALEEARKLDAYFERTGKIIGPLHGIPISVKEMVNFKDRICHTAYVAWIDQVSSQDALLIRILREAGALFHVRTNEPQTVMVSNTQISAVVFTQQNSISIVTTISMAER